MVRPQSHMKELDLLVTCDPDIVVARLDRGMFRQVLLNLLANAVKFTEPGGTVEVRASRSDDELLVSVRDTGIGMTEEDTEKIFKAFYQVDGSYARQYEGTGLGLALVQRMVEIQHGSVTVTSSLGQGSCFTLSFPESVVDDVRLSDRDTEEFAGEDEPRPAPTPRELDRPALLAATEDPEPLPFPAEGEFGATSESGCTILVVEDNPMNRKLARNALRRTGWRILEATTGEAALETLAVERVDLVLMDLQLPGLDGLETTRRIKANPRLRDIVVVAVTAHVKEADEELAIDAGCVGYLTKPIRLAQFPEQVAGFLTESCSS